MFYLKKLRINQLYKTWFVDTRRYSHENDNTKQQSMVSSDDNSIFALEAHISIFGKKTLLSEPVAEHEESIILGEVSVYRKRHKVNQLFYLLITLNLCYDIKKYF